VFSKLYTNSEYKLQRKQNTSFAYTHSLASTLDIKYTRNQALYVKSVYSKLYTNSEYKLQRKQYTSFEYTHSLASTLDIKYTRTQTLNL